MKIRLDDVMQSLSYPYDAAYFYYIPLETVLMFRGGRIFGKAVHDIATLEDVKRRKKDFIALPDLGEKGRRMVMLGFARTLPEGETRERVHEAASGPDPENALDNVLRDEGLLLNWFNYRDEIYRDFSQKWCEEMGLDWIG